MVTKDLERILSNKNTREGFFNNPRFYIKPTWKRIYDSPMLVTYQNKEQTTEISVQKIYVGTMRSDYMWRISKSIPYRMTKLIILNNFSTKKEAIQFAMEYMKGNSK